MGLPAEFEQFNFLLRKCVGAPEAYGRIAFFQPPKCWFSLHLNGLWLMRTYLPQSLPIRFPCRSSAVLRLRTPTRKRLSSSVHSNSILSSLSGVNELRNTEMPDRPIDAQDSPPSLMQAGLCGTSVAGKFSGRSVSGPEKWWSEATGRSSQTDFDSSPDFDVSTRRTSHQRIPIGASRSCYRPEWL